MPPLFRADPFLFQIGQLYQNRINSTIGFNLRYFIMITDQTTPEDFINERRGQYIHIKGWGMDFDPKNDPTFPIKKRNNEEHQGYAWQRTRRRMEV